MAGNYYKILSLFILITVISQNAQTQDDTTRTIVLNQVNVTEKKSSFRTNSRAIISVNKNEIKEKGALTLSDAISSLPGVNQITTGAVSNPVIDGLYGDRIQIIVAGLKLEDQKWEDEYGLGLSDIGISGIEMIKGPASLIFGSNAMGGVINIIPESSSDSSGVRHDLGLRLLSNTMGAGINYGFKKPGKNVLILNCGIESNADYYDGEGNRVPNTRFALNNINLGYIVQRKKIRSENHLFSYFNQFGFVADSSELTEDENESRFSREFEDDHCTAFLLLLSSMNSVRFNETTDLNFTLGVQSNLRQEQERSDEVEMSLLLNTFSLNASIQKRINNSWTVTNGVSGMFQTNKNYADRIIVPDAGIGEGSLYSYFNHIRTIRNLKSEFEAGLRYDYRNIKTVLTESEDPLYDEITPFKKSHNNLNGSIGECLGIKNFTMKFDLSTGFRTGNLAELSANGLHEGTTKWYIGNPDLKTEKCLDLNVSASWHNKWLTLRGSVFRNSFRNYIFLQPTNEKIYEYTIYRYVQSDATLQGFNAGTTIEKEGCFSISLDYSFLNAQREDGSWLPFTPANRYLFNGKYFIHTKNQRVSNAFVSFGVNRTQMQNHTGLYELSTPGYWLLNTGAGAEFRSLSIVLSCNNLANQVYYDHLSRLKYYGLNDMGRNIILNIGWRF